MTKMDYRMQRLATTVEISSRSVENAVDPSKKKAESQEFLDLLPGLTSSDRRLRESALNLLRFRLAETRPELLDSDLLWTILALASEEPDEDLRAKVISIAASLDQIPMVDPNAVAANLLMALQAHSAATSGDTFAVMCERLVMAIAGIVETASKLFKPDFLRAFHATALALAENEGIRVRVCALSSLVRVVLYVRDNASRDQTFARLQQPGGGIMPLGKTRELLIDFVRNDPSCLVRRAAMDGLISLCAHDAKFDQGLYGICITMLKDADDQTMMRALNLLCLLSSKFPKAIVRLTPSSPVAVWLPEDVFLRICEAATDLSPTVREAACGRLAGFSGLKEDLILQTLLKTPSAATGPGVTGVQISHAAQGALTHGLEDEVQGVRMATIDAICALCRGSDRFRDNARTMLVAMFTDESSAIRLKAVTSLGTIVRRSGLVVGVEQVQQMLAAVEDAHQNIRAEAYKVFGFVIASDADCLQFLIQRLFHSMVVRTEDRLLIYAALGKIGKNHWTIIGTEPIIDELLTWDRNFLPKEHSTEDQFHVAKLIMLFNAAAVKPTVLGMLPPYALDQYGYVRAMFGNIVPALTIPDPAEQTRTGQEMEDISARRCEPTLKTIEELMAKVQKWVSALRPLLALGDYGEAGFWIQRSRRHLQYVASMRSSLAATADFTERYLDLCEVAIKLKSPQRAAEYRRIYNRVLSTCAKLREKFAGFPEFPIASLVSQFRILARAVSMTYAPNRREWNRARGDVIRMARKRARAEPPPDEREASALASLIAGLAAMRFEMLRGTAVVFGYMRAFVPEHYSFEREGHKVKFAKAPLE